MTATTATVEHTLVVEIESVYGRYWSEPMPESEVKDYIERATSYGDGLSDIDCTTLCMHPDHDSDADFVRWREEALAAQAEADAEEF